MLAFSIYFRVIVKSFTWLSKCHWAKSFSEPGYFMAAQPYLRIVAVPGVSVNKILIGLTAIKHSL